MAVGTWGRVFNIGTLTWLATVKWMRRVHTDQCRTVILKSSHTSLTPWTKEIYVHFVELQNAKCPTYFCLHLYFINCVCDPFQCLLTTLKHWVWIRWVEIGGAVLQVAMRTNDSQQEPGLAVIRFWSPDAQIGKSKNVRPWESSKPPK